MSCAHLAMVPDILASCRDLRLLNMIDPPSTNRAQGCVTAVNLSFPPSNSATGVLLGTRTATIPAPELAGVAMHPLVYV